MNKLLPTTVRNPKGFTLVELLIVVSILAILAVVGVTIFSGVQSRARDGKRQTDIQAIAKALEANKVAGSITYPEIETSWFGAGVPVEVSGYVPRYSIVYTTAVGAAAVKPTSWAADSANPGAPSGETVATVADGVPGSGLIYSFQICALLENGTAPNIFCIPNTQ